MRATVERVAAELEALGHHLAPAFDWEAVLASHVTSWSVGLFNTTGTPRSAEEPTLLRLAAQLEAALPWDQRQPAVCAGSTIGVGAREADTRRSTTSTCGSTRANRGSREP